ncbi:hypothetical protein FHS01_000975 [Longimicrobium terrae]|uniref:Uncharacterized protein n=1 Tax=Longimicrobium terrae TaxID=1639882 RepID=A0A841GSK2_9BACT|nr:hypothetical protein [Longimicrobium terrae]MBB6069359.1 hypothetical protein [Longimicrobium terrae]
MYRTLHDSDGPGVPSLLLVPRWTGMVGPRVTGTGR